ncbi:hypothetical protein Tco_0691180 [Tanacetum coccineum]
MYNMARTPYARSPSTFTKKGITSSYGREEALTSSQSTFQHGGKMVKKLAGCTSWLNGRSVLDDELDLGGPLRSTRQRANLLNAKKDKKNSDARHFTAGPRDYLEAGEGEFPKLIFLPHDNQHPERLHDSRELTSKGKEKVEDNGPRKFPITRNMMSSVNGELSVTSKDKAPAVRINEPPLKLPAEPQKKKRPFQMSAREDDLFELDDDDETRVNGHMSLLLVESNKQKTS